ncbi:hypothetical protein GAMM_60235 [Gammaproteobacteria bacterium]
MEMFMLQQRVAMYGNIQVVVGLILVMGLGLIFYPLLFFKVKKTHTRG